MIWNKVAALLCPILYFEEGAQAVQKAPVMHLFKHGLKLLARVLYQTISLD